MRILAAAIAAVFAIPAWAQNAVPVTVQNFPRAKSDLYMGNAVKDGGFGKFHHNRTPTEIDKQLVIRMNRDTLYSAAVFDLDAGPVTITLPKAGKCFMSLQAISEDHYAPFVIYQPASLTLTKDNVGTRYVWPRSAHWSIRTIQTTSRKSTLCRTQSRSARKTPANSRCRTGIRPAEESARCAAGSWLDDQRFQERLRPQRPGRPGAASDRHRDGLGRQSRTRTPPMSVSRRPRTTARRSTSSRSRMCR